LNENYGDRKTPYTVFLKEAFSKVSESDTLKWLVDGIAMFNVAYLFYMFTYQLFLLNKGLNIVFLGFVFSLLVIVRALFSFLSSSLGKRVSYIIAQLLGTGDSGHGIYGDGNCPKHNNSCNWPDFD
jgi:hypothetical protein